ncbi:helicase-related protein [Senegalia massiliensis]|uniref:Helicase C-terminal domain-containing protein n=1 Tax=Senegalia massiliensis TaxID=1720316 RepID=A0A845QZ04_9CLOT|nr:helicase-related protein [Senegalia massiliensis]NBI07531.1 hypothetical protein [Senegalia massiliensis]
MKIKRVIKCIEGLVESAKEILSLESYNRYEKYNLSIMKTWLEGLSKQGFEPKERFEELHNTIDALYNSSNSAIYVYVKELYNPARELLSLLEGKAEELEPYKFQEINVDHNYYKAKTVLYDEDSETNTKTIRYIIATFLSEQQMKAMLSNLQKGMKRIKIGDNWNEVAQAVSNGYRCLYQRTTSENVGDGVHAIIYNEDERVIKVHQEDNPVDRVYQFIAANCKTGIIPNWKSYFYNKLTDEGLLRECKGFDYTGKAPSIIVLSEEINTELIMQYKEEGLRKGLIKLDVEENVELSEDATFFELVNDYVIPYIKEEKVHYQVGDPISPIISSPIDFGKGKIGKLYPKQQITAQGGLKAMKDGKPFIILSGSMGVGKTLISSKLALAQIYEMYGKFNGRIALFCQGILINKWQREFLQACKPLRIKPRFIRLDSLENVKKLDKEPKGLEVLLISRDKSKRSYLEEMATNERFNKNSLMKITNFKEKVVAKHEDNKVVFVNSNELPIHLMKIAGRRIEKETQKPTILYKKQLDNEGNIISYKIVTPSKTLKNTFTTNNYKSYDFELNSVEFTNFNNHITENLEVLIDESEYKIHRQTSFDNGLVCPSCGGYIYQNPQNLFHEEKYTKHIRRKKKDKSSSFLKCNHYVKADGTTLMDFEIKGIREGEISVAFVDDTETITYLDAENNPIEGSELLDVKANKYTGIYIINVKKCNQKLWSAVDKKGYRTVNTLAMTKRKFKSKFIDFAIVDEFHQFSAQSNQGYTYGLLANQSKYMINLSGTISSGTASSLFYLLYRLYPQKMKKLGYEYSEVGKFIDHYGRREKKTKIRTEHQYNKSGKGYKSSPSVKEKAGISPLLYTNLLSDVMIARTIEDMQLPMPKLKYYKHEIEMSSEIKNGYDNLKQQLIDFMKENKHLPLGGSYLHSLLSYPDLPQQSPIYWNKTDMLVATPEHIDLKDKILPKEQKLIDTINREISEGRKVLVYMEYTGEKGISKRVINILRDQGIKAIEMKSNGKGKVKTEEREEWIEQKSREGYQCILTNPKLVEVGLNIIDYPSIYYYECPLGNVKLLRQSERRAWRTNQKQECRIYYSYYSETLQEDLLKLIGGKKKASLALEGVFSEDLLSNMGDVDDGGSEALFKVLKGKITMKEDDLEGFGFSDESDLENIIKSTQTINDNANNFNTNIHSNDSRTQIDLFTITEEELTTINKKEKKKKNIGEGQLRLFAM